MEEKERYIVTTMDGKVFNYLANTFGEVIQEFGEDRIFSITKLHFREA